MQHGKKIHVAEMPLNSCRKWQVFSVGIRLQMELKCGCSVCAHTATAKAGGKMYYGANGAMVPHFIGTTQDKCAFNELTIKAGVSCS